MCDLAIADVPVFLDQHPDGFVWVALVDPSPEELSLLQRHFLLHPLVIEDTLKANQRPKLEEYGQSLFLVMQAVEFPDQPGAEWRLGEVHVVAGPNYVISIRRNYSRGFTDVRERCEREPHLLRLGPGFILYALVDSMVDRYFPVVGRLEAELESLEEQIFRQANPAGNMEVLYSLKQKIVFLKHSVVDLLEAVGKLHGGRVPAICLGVQDYFGDVVDHLHRISTSVESLREMLTTAIHVNLTMVSIADSQVSKRLAAWAAILAVPTMIAGIYGMNFRHMPELDSPYGYPTVLAAIALVDLVLYFRFKRAKWI